jgi:hypothetical protein
MGRLVIAGRAAIGDLPAGCSRRQSRGQGLFFFKKDCGLLPNSGPKKVYK